tara:strand:+ start:146 stop:628 length:483 start_codon:yes stop_codon:yes gene_type:complete
MSSQNTFYWTYSGQQHEFSDIPYLLTIGLLEEDYTEYLFLLQKAYENNIDISYVLNDTSTSSGWFSPHATCLAFLVGSHTDASKSNSSINRAFYGSEMSEGIPDEVGCVIFNLMITKGINLSIINYYNVTIMDVLNTTSEMFSREKNTNFKQLVQTYFNN